MGQAHMYNLHKKIQACAWYFFPQVWKMSSTLIFLSEQ